jgi:predicted membrane protein DUF2142
VRAFLVAFVGFFLLAGAWAVSLPVNGTYDESQHIVRAYAAVDMQWPPHGPNRQSFDVPATLLPANPECMHEDKHAYRPASCLRPRTERGTVTTETYVARYNPLYYLAVGLPIRLWPDTTGIVLARLLSALLCAAMLAAAVGIAITQGNRLLAAAVALVATPMVVNLAGSVNPNGLEICAGVLLFASGLGLIRDVTGPRRALLACAAVAAFVLVAVRHIGPLLLVIDLAALAVLAGPAALRAAARRRDVWAWLGGGALAGLVVYGGWLLLARSPVGPGPGTPTDLGVAGILRGLLTDRIRFYVQQIVGQFGYGETTMSPLAIALWYALVAAVVLPVAWRAGWRVRGVLAGLVVLGFGMLVALEFYFVPTDGWFSHGRYALPVLVGVVLIAAVSDPRALRWWWAPALVLATAPVHLYALTRALSRYRVGIDASLSPFGGSWDPPVPAPIALLAVLVGVAAAAGAAMLTVRDEDGTDNRASTRTVSAN